MASELKAVFPLAGTLYAVITRQSDGQAWNGSAFEAVLTADWATYVVAMTRQSTTWLRYGNLPAGVGTTPCNYTVYLQAGGSPAVTDAPVGVGTVNDAVGNVTVGGYATGQDPATLLAAAVTGGASGTWGAAIGRIGTAQIVTSSIVAQNGNFRVVAGTDYFAADGRAIDFTDASASWPDLTGATAVTITIYSGTAVFVRPLEFVTRGGSNQKVRWEPSAADTLAMPSSGQFKIVVTLLDTHLVELASGNATASQT